MEFIFGEPCPKCGETFPGDHRQEIDHTPGERDLIFWLCPIIDCAKPMASGLACALAPDHDGPCRDKYGLRDPLPVAEVHA